MNYDLNDTHFAVHKGDKLIVFAWDYSDVEPSELKQFKKDYFDADLKGNGFDPKDFCIWTKQYCIKNNVNPDNDECWATGLEYFAEGKKYTVSIKNGSKKPIIEKLTLREGVEFQKIAQERGIKYTILEDHKRSLNKIAQQKPKTAMAAMSHADWEDCQNNHIKVGVHKTSKKDALDRLSKKISLDQITEGCGKKETMPVENLIMPSSPEFVKYTRFGDYSYSFDDIVEPKFKGNGIFDDYPDFIKIKIYQDKFGNLWQSNCYNAFTRDFDGYNLIDPNMAYEAMEMDYGKAHAERGKEIRKSEEI